MAAESARPEIVRRRNEQAQPRNPEHRDRTQQMQRTLRQTFTDVCQQNRRIPIISQGKTYLLSIFSKVLSQMRDF